MHKKVVLLAVSCKTGGLCPGGIDLDNPYKWIRIVKDDGHAGAVQGVDIDFAQPLDIIEFDGRPMPQGRQLENWVIDNCSCKKTDSRPKFFLLWAYQHYGYHGFWGNFRPYLNKVEFEHVSCPSESMLIVSDVCIYKNDFNRAKIDFKWSGAPFRIKGVSMTDQDFYEIIDHQIVEFKIALIVIAIPKEIDDWTDPATGEQRAYKFVSKVFEIPEAWLKTSLKH